MQSKRRFALLGVLALALSVTVGLGAGVAEAKKKGGKVGGLFTATKAVNLPVPDRGMGADAPFGTLVSTIDVGGKKFKKTRVGAGSVQVTGLKTTGSGAGAAADLTYYLSAPNGRTVMLAASNLGGGGAQGVVSLGPLTLSPDVKTLPCDQMNPPCANPFRTVLRPFIGTIQDLGLQTFEGLAAPGTWTLTVHDTSNTLSSILNSWGLSIRTVPKPITTLPRR